MQRRRGLKSAALLLLFLRGILRVVCVTILRWFAVGFVGVVFVGVAG